MTPLERFNRIRDLPVPRLPKLVLFLLAAYADKHGREAFPSPHTLARQGDMSIRSAREALRYLVSAGLIKAHDRLPKPRQYSIHVPDRLEEWQGLPLRGGRDCQQKRTPEEGHNNDRQIIEDEDGLRTLVNYFAEDMPDHPN